MDMNHRAVKSNSTETDVDAQEKPETSSITQQNQGQSAVLEFSDTFCGDEFKGNAAVLLYSTHYLVSCDSL